VLQCVAVRCCMCFSASTLADCHIPHGGSGAKWEGRRRQVGSCLTSLPALSLPCPHSHTHTLFTHAQVVVLSGKGGVGKSTVASQLAMLLSHLPSPDSHTHASAAATGDARGGGGGAGGGGGKRGATGLLGIDICGPSAPRMMGVEANEVCVERALCVHVKETRIFMMCVYVCVCVCA